MTNKLAKYKLTSSITQAVPPKELASKFSPAPPAKPTEFAEILKQVVSCDFHTKTTAPKSYTNFLLHYLLCKVVIQTVLGMGTGMNVTSQVEGVVLPGATHWQHRRFMAYNK